MSIQYRPEIDGLRAIAVIPVILFHAGFSFFSGGYVGVDVFFVISGYLITSIIYSEMIQKDFSISRFYERRARRILPALFVMMFICIPFSWYWMMPHEFKKFCLSIIGVSTFTSNIYFWFDSGYFSSANETKPLLHTWSLAVEEQFYILLPPLLLFCWRIKRVSLTFVISLITLLSFISAQYASTTYPEANFYLLPTRAWELGIGVLIALSFRENKPPKINEYIHEIGAFLGVALIIFSIFNYDEATPFPSIYALAPVLGTALIIIFTMKQTLVARLLSLGPLVYIGLISYSAYLWHQPILAFARLRSNGDVSSEGMWGLMILIFCLAWLSWRFVETPVRRGIRSSRRNVFILSAGACMSFAAIGVLGVSQIDLIQKSSTLASIEKWKSSISPARSKCHATKNNLIPPEQACNLGNDTKKQIYVWADSHGVELSWELSKVLLKESTGVKQLTASQCIPTTDVKSTRENHCVDYNASVFKYLTEKAPRSVVVLIARWSLYFNGSRVDTAEGCKELGAPGQRFSTDWKGRDQEGRMLDLARKLEKTIRGLNEAGHKVILVRSMPEPGCDIPNQYARLVETQGTIKRKLISTPFSIYKLRTKPFESYFQYKSTNMVDVRLDEIFCNHKYPGRCLSETEQGPLYFDSNHPNLIAANLIAKAVLKKLIDKNWLN